MLAHAIVRAGDLAHSLLVSLHRYYWLSTTTPAVLLLGYHRIEALEWAKNVMFKLPRPH